MSGVEFLGATFVEDGSEKSLAISGDLPEGVYVTYENNGQSAFGIYEITAIFHGDYDNYYEITDMTAQLVIKRASMSQIVEEDVSDTPNVVVSEAGGTNPNFNLVVKKQETVSDEILDNVERDELVVFVYDITLQFNGSSVQPDRMLTIKLLIPEEIGDKSFRILHMHDGTVTELEYITEGGYAVFSVDNLSEFAIVADNLGSGLWLVIVLAVLLIVELILIISKKNKNKKKGETYLAGVFGGVLAIHEIVLLAVLGAAVVGLGIYAVCLYAPKKKTHRGESVDATANRAKSVETAWTIAAANDKDKQVLNKTECKADAVDVADDADAEREVAAAEAAVAQAQVVFDSVDALPDADKKILSKCDSIARSRLRLRCQKTQRRNFLLNLQIISFRLKV